jgi:hypothetical protein
MAESRGKHVTIEFPVFLLNNTQRDAFHFAISITTPTRMWILFCFSTLTSGSLRSSVLWFGTMFGSALTPSFPQPTGKPRSGALIALSSDGITF